MAWISAVSDYREHFLKCSPVVSWSFQHQADWVWDLDVLSPPGIWRHLRPFHFCSMAVSSHSVPNCLPSWDWNFLMHLNSMKGFGVQNAERCKEAANKVNICMRKRGIQLLKARIASSWYSISFLWWFCWVFLTSFKAFMYVFSMCSWWLAYRKPNFSFLFITLFNFMVTHYHVATHSLQPSPMG